MKEDDNQALFQKAYQLAMAFDERRDDKGVWATASAEELLARLNPCFPESGKDPIEVLDELAAAVEPGLTGVTSGRFFGWVIGGSHPVGRAADWLTSTWAQNAVMNQVTPAASAIEEVVGNWLKTILRLPQGASVGVTTGATMANFTAMAAARSHLLEQAGWNFEEDGLQGAPRLNVIVGMDVHTTVIAGLRFLGIGSKQVLRVETDDQGCMLVPAFKSVLNNCQGPTLVLSQAGQINTGAMDPFAEIIPLCRDKNAWVHVDGAFGLWANASPTYAHLTPGLDQADSWTVDGHKWLQVPYDCGFVFVNNAEAHKKSMMADASYMLSSDEGLADPAHKVPELSRRARGFAAWAVIRTLGRKGIIEMIDFHCSLAHMLAEQLSAEEGIQVLNDVVLNQIAVYFGSDDKTRAVLAALREENNFALGGALWRGKWIMRVSIISWQTERETVKKLAADIIRLNRQLS